MLSLYIFCLIIGGGLLAFSLLGGIDDADADFDADLDADCAADLDVEVEGKIDGEVAGAHHAGGGWTPLRDFLFVRSLIYFLAGFGAAGVLLRWFTEAPAVAEVFSAALTGLVAAFLAGSLYGWVRLSESGMVARDNDYLVGRPHGSYFPSYPDAGARSPCSQTAERSSSWLACTVRKTELATAAMR